NAISPRVFPLPKMAEAFLEALRENAPQELEGLKHVFIGHIHAPYGTTHDEGDVEFRVTGAASHFSKNTLYQFDVTDNGLTNIEAQALGRGFKKPERAEAGR